MTDTIDEIYEFINDPEEEKIDDVDDKIDDLRNILDKWGGRR